MSDGEQQAAAHYETLMRRVICRIVADVVRELEQQIEELRAIPVPPRAADQETE